MKVSITSIKLQSIWKVPAMVLHSFKIKSQSKKAGALEVKSSGFGMINYTMSLWPDEETMLAFTKSGAHLEALKKSRVIAEEICLLTIDGTELPELEKAKSLLDKEGRTIRY